MTVPTPEAAGDPLIFLVAGEPSGDQLGARLMAALRRETGGRVRFAGVGGERMAAQGLVSLFPIDEIAVMGLVEVLPHVFRIYRRIKETVAAVEAARPAALVTIDSPNFSFEVCQRLRGSGIRMIHYVAPSVWAWKPGRARRIAAYLDHLLTLLPFEPPYFEVHGLATTFVGHPAVEGADVAVDPAAFRDRHGIPPDAPLLCLLPGSRRGEVRRLAPAFSGALALLKRGFPDLQVVVPTIPTVAAMVEAAARDWPLPAVILREPEAKYQAFAAATAALAASGTIAVELAVAGLPAVIAYRVNPVTALLLPYLVKVRYISIPNLVLGRPVQPEVLQGKCTAEGLAAAVGRLLSDPAARQAQRIACREAAIRLGLGGEAPSHKAARVVLSVIRAGGAGTGAYIEENREEVS